MQAQFWTLGSGTQLKVQPFAEPKGSRSSRASSATAPGCTHGGGKPFGNHWLEAAEAWSTASFPCICIWGVHLPGMGPRSSPDGRQGPPVPDSVLQTHVLKRFNLLSFLSKQIGFTGEVASEWLFPTQILSSWGQAGKTTVHLSTFLKPGKGTPHFFRKAQVAQEDVKHLGCGVLCTFLWESKGENVTLNSKKKTLLEFRIQSTHLDLTNGAKISCRDGEDRDWLAAPGGNG